MVPLFQGSYTPHVLSVHFPMILLLTAPLLVAIALGLSAEKRRLLLWSALVLMTFGTTMAFVAIATGETAMNLVASTPGITAAVQSHRASAEATAELFALLTLGLAGLMAVPRWLGCELDSRLHATLLGVYLLFYASGVLFLLHTAAQGERLARQVANPTVVARQLSRRESTR